MKEGSGVFFTDQTIRRSSVLTGREIEANVHPTCFALPGDFELARVGDAAAGFEARMRKLVAVEVAKGYTPGTIASAIGFRPQLLVDLAPVWTARSREGYLAAMSVLMAKASGDVPSPEMFAGDALPRRAIDALLLLWRHGALLFPTGIMWAHSLQWVRRFPDPDEEGALYGEATSAFVDIRGDLSDAGAMKVKRPLLTILLCSKGIVDPGDLDEGLVRVFWNTAPRDAVKHHFFGPNEFAQRLKQVQVHQYAGDRDRLELIPESYRPNAGRRTDSRSDPSFDWAASFGVHVFPWTDFLSAHVASFTNRVTVNFEVLQLSRVMDFVVDRPDIAEPLPFCFKNSEGGDELLRSIKSGLSEGMDLRRVLLVVHSAFRWLLEMKACDEDGEVKRGYRNPISINDVPGCERRPGQTYRHPIPSKYVRMLCEILDEEDGRDADGEVLKAWIRTIQSDYFKWKDPELGRTFDVWSPVRSKLVRLRLELPIRTIQARLLDSGEADPTVYKPKQGGWIDNEGLWRGSKRDKRGHQGFVRRIFDAELGQWFDGLFITTNKTQDRQNRFEGSGYEIPWQNPLLLALFEEVRDFQEQYNPITRLLSRADLAEAKLKTSSDLAARLPKLAFLFRDPCRAESTQPVSEHRVGAFWCLLVEELERRLKTRGIKNLDGSDIKLVVSRETTTGKPLSVLFDMHSVRVTGLTALADAGVPLHILSEFVAGHATYLMTLYYQRPSASQVTRVLSEAVAAVSDNEERDWIAYLTDRPADMIAAVAAVNDEALVGDIGIFQPGLWSRTDIGLCPNGATKCNVGGELITASKLEPNKHAPVPEGPRNCALCRFFVTGPIYLGGLVARLNQTSSEIRESFISQEAKQRARRAAIAERDTSTGEAQRRLAVKVVHLEEALERVEDGLDVLCRRWAALLRLVLRSRQILASERAKPEDAVDAPPRNAMVMTGGADELHASFERCSDFALWDAVCRSSDFHAGVETKLPTLRRGKLYDIVFGRNGMSPVFFKLDDADALAVGNALSNFIRSQVDGDTIDRLVAGDVGVDELGIRDAVERCLVEAVTPPPLAFEPPKQPGRTAGVRLERADGGA